MFYISFSTETAIRNALVKFDRARVDAAVKAGAQRVKDDLRDYYDVKDATEPNRFFRSGEGARRLHFWQQIRDSISGPHLMYRNVRILIWHRAFMQKLHGGPIVPKRAKMLTIPTNGEAYGRSAAEVESMFGKLFVVRMKDGRLFLAGKPQNKLTFFFKLVDYVQQDPWPGTWPGMKFVRDSFRSGFRYRLKRG